MLLESPQGSVAPDEAGETTNCGQTRLSVAERDVPTAQLGQLADSHEALLPYLRLVSHGSFRLSLLPAVSDVATGQLHEPSMDRKPASILLVDHVLSNDAGELALNSHTAITHSRQIILD